MANVTHKRGLSASEVCAEEGTLETVKLGCSLDGHPQEPRNEAGELKKSCLLAAIKRFTSGKAGSKSESVMEEKEVLQKF